MRLVAGKAAWVRIYMRSGLPQPIPGVTGVLNVYHRHHGLWQLTATLNPNEPGTAIAKTTAEREPPRG